MAEPQPVTTVDFPVPLPLRKRQNDTVVDLDDVAVPVSNVRKAYWSPEGYTKADLLGYYYNAAPWVLPYLAGRPLTLKRMPNGADGEFFYAKQAPTHTPSWVTTAPVTSVADGKTIDYLLAQDTASLLWIANLGCIEMHPWHARVDDIGHPDYAFFDLDPMGTDFATVRDVALLVHDALEHLGLRSYPRTSGATGMQVFVPVDRVHSSSDVRRFVERICRFVHQADPERTTMTWAVQDRPRAVYLDYGMNTEGKNIAGTYSLRPERDAPVATPLTWEEVATDVHPRDFTIASVWSRLSGGADLGAPILQGGQDLFEAMTAVGLTPERDHGPRHRVELASSIAQKQAQPGMSPAERLERYGQRRDFAKSPEPPPTSEPSRPRSDAPRFVVQHHLATRLHHDLRLEHRGTAASWAVPKGLPDVPGVQHLAIQTEDHPLDYLDFSGDIPQGEYGAGPMRIWDQGTYETLEWRNDGVKIRLHGSRHDGEFHLFRTGDDPTQWLVIRTGQPETLPHPPPDLRPMLAVDGGGRVFDDPAWRFEVKWDGVRAIATTRRPGAGQPAATTLVSRAGNDLTGGYPELASLWERVLARNAVLDGEIVVLDERGRSSFQLLQRRMHLRDRAAIDRLRRTVKVTYMAFDLLVLDGEELTSLPLSERLDLLGEVLIPGSAVRHSDGVDGQGSAMFSAAIEHGLEGLIAKRLDSPYRPGARSRNWLKLKVRRRARVVIGGFMPGEGKRTGRPGSLLAGAYEGSALRYVGRVGTGFTEEELDRLEERFAHHTADASPFGTGPSPPAGARWLRADLVCAIEYGEVTSEGLLRAAAYKGLDPEADPGACSYDALQRNA